MCYCRLSDLYWNKPTRLGVIAQPDESLDPLPLFKILILQQLFNLIHSDLEVQVNDRRSFVDFIGLGIIDVIPDVTTLALSVNVY